MPDIFLSYNREDQTVARRFAEAFHAEGLEVWWDATLRSGEAYDEVTETALKTAKAVVVLWSPRSVVSRWVRAEATLADRNKTLLPATIEACDRPIMFELTQTADLTHWAGDRGDVAWRAFVDDVRRLVQSGPQAPSEAPRTAAPASAARPEGLSICVLPFSNMSGDAEQEYFSDGIAEDIITDLSKVAALSVISRNSAFTFKGRHVDLPQVARQLNVTHVLEGSVRKAGPRVRITAQLIDGVSNTHVWAERYDRDLSDIFALQDEISQAIVAALKLKLFPDEKQAIEDRGGVSVEVWDLYLRARAKSAASLTPADLHKSAAMYRKVLELAPDFAPGRGAQAVLYTLLMTFDPESNDETIRMLDQTVREGEERSPGHWATHFASGVLFSVRHDWTAAIRATEKARALAPPTEAEIAYISGAMIAGVGRMDEAVEVLLAARRVDPLSMSVSTILQQALYMSGRYGEAQAEYERARDVTGGRHASEHAMLLLSIDRGDDADAVKAQFRRFIGAQTVPMPLFEQLLEFYDRPEEALAATRRAFDDPANHRNGTRMMMLAWHAAILGDVELSVAALRRAFIEMKAPLLMSLWLPSLRDVRKSEGFRTLVKDIGFDRYWRETGQWGDFARPVGDDDFEIIR